MGSDISSGVLTSAFLLWRLKAPKLIGKDRPVSPEQTNQRKERAAPGSRAVVMLMAEAPGLALTAVCRDFSGLQGLAASPSFHPEGPLPWWSAAFLPEAELWGLKPTSILGSRCWVPGSGFWVLCSGFQVPGRGLLFLSLSLSIWIQRSNHWGPSSRWLPRPSKMKTRPNSNKAA